MFFANGRFVIGLHGAALATSLDGVAWDESSPRLDGYITAIHWYGETLFLGAEGASIVTCTWPRA